ncbi:EcsC family protein [Limnobaculum parvum]|uniref:EcsC family protein n=1 Tax=Limnobaculum parvum TaxID=2172103 RepID=A0A2Y9TXJ7_9GAMM|nr:EcsC family protein [Limnobaculum parvum]AWH88219.1 EcsC family protein [Limnobaculum parvum]
MKNSLTIATIQQALDWAYDKAVNGVKGLDTAQEIAESYMKEGNSPINNANSLIRWQNSKAITSGFITGLGGVMVMPVALPANITSVLYIQLRMIAAIAYMGGYDLKDDKVRTIVYACLCGSAVSDILKRAGVDVGKKLTLSTIKNMSGAIITKINQAVGFRLLTKFGSKGVINLGKLVPVVGGVIGGTLDGVTTNIIGNTARNQFLKDDDNTERYETKNNSACIDD